MKTTIDIPDPLYRAAKTRAVTETTTPEDVLLRVLERELRPAFPTETKVPYFARRKLLPEFERLQASGAFCPKPEDHDITDLISEDREDRSQ